MKGNVITKSDGLFAVDRVRVSTRNTDGFPYMIDPAHIVQKTDLFIRDGIITGIVLPRSGGQSGERIRINDMRGSVRQHMRDPNEGDGVFDGHVLAVDIASPNVTDTLFTLQIILRDMLHCDRGIFKMLYLPLGRSSALGVGIQNHEDQHYDHNEYIDQIDPGFFHSAFCPRISFPNEPAHLQANDAYRDSLRLYCTLFFD